MLVIAKPSGVPVLGDRSGLQDLYARLRHEYRKKAQDLHVVHRIDKGTSGVLLFAKTEEVRQELCRQFETAVFTRPTMPS